MCIGNQSLQETAPAAAEEARRHDVKFKSTSTESLLPEELNVLLGFVSEN